MSSPLPPWFQLFYIQDELALQIVLICSLASEDIKQKGTKKKLCESVWPSTSSKALGWEAEGPWFESASALLSLQKLWSVDTVLQFCPSQL